MAVSVQGVPGALVEVFSGVIQIAAQASVVSVGVNPRHGIGKQPCASIHLVAGLGVEGDAHMGALVQHRWLKKKDPTLPNRTQVHLLHEELFAELSEAGLSVGAGELGENVTTRGVDLLRLPVGTQLRFGREAIVEVTGLREPCAQLNKVSPPLLEMLRYRQAGRIVRKAGIMGIVLCGGEVQPGDAVTVMLPQPPWVTMGPV